MILPAVAGGLAASAGLMGWAVRGRSSQLLASSVWRGPQDRPAIALTFDDGPSESTPRFLDVLAEYGAEATFFQVGANVDRLPAVARAVAEGGHEIGNHSYSHPRFDFTSAAFQLGEMRRTQRAIEEAAGVRPRWFRAPYGVRWFGMAGAQRACGLTGAMWTAIGLDWKLGATAISRRLLERVGNGAVFCLHDGRGLERDPDVSETLGALREMLPELKRRGFALLTLGSLMEGVAGADVAGCGRGSIGR